VTQAQRALPRLVREAEDGAVVGIARRDETVAYLLSRDHLEAIVESASSPSSEASSTRCCSSGFETECAGKASKPTPGR